MRIALLVFTILAATGCFVPGDRGLALKRTKLWAPPGAATVFSWVSRVEHREDTVVGTSKDNLEVEHNESDRETRSTIYAVDPATHRETRLGEVKVGVEALYYDATRGVLWVRDDKGTLLGLAGAGRAVGPAHGQHLMLVKGLEPPFVLTTSGDDVTLYNLATDGKVMLPASVKTAAVTVEGAVVRFTSLVTLGTMVQVYQQAVDWSSGTPNRLPDVNWTTGSLPGNVGTRLEFTMLRDGRYAEVVRNPSETRLLVYDLFAPAPVAIVPLPRPDSPPSTAPGVRTAPVTHLAAAGGDAIVFGEGAASGKEMCWRGTAVRVNRALAVPLPDQPCVIDAGDLGGGPALFTDESRVLLVDAQAKLVALEGINRGTLSQAVPAGPTSQAFMRGDDGTLVVLDLATGEQKRHRLGVAAHDRLLAVGAGIAMFARGADTVLTVPLTEHAAPSTLVLPAPVMTRADRMLRDRNEFWIGGGGGISTRAAGVGRFSLEVAHWVTDHWTAVGRAGARFESKPSAAMTEPKSFDAGASFGFAWHRLPRLWSLAFGANLGANYAATYLGKVRTDQGFAPSAEVHIGAQGSMFGIDLAAVAPSLIDTDRGVSFLLSMKIGFTENLR